MANVTLEIYLCIYHYIDNQCDFINFKFTLVLHRAKASYSQILHDDVNNAQAPDVIYIFFFNIKKPTPLPYSTPDVILLYLTLKINNELTLALANIALRWWLNEN